MQKLRILKPCGIYKEDEIITIENNMAHGLIDSGYAELYTEKEDKQSYKSRMMRPKISSSYHTK